MPSTTPQTQKLVPRPPVVAVLGHIDHGKSKLLDYIRKTNIVEHEAGNITQHLSAYEAVVRDSAGQERKITFLDTPGHEAFQAMRRRGADVADLAILIVSAEEGAKAQTTEAYKAITDAGIPFIVAINKIDKPGADVEKTKISLAEQGIYLEGFGGKVPFAEISAKAGTGVDHLLELVLLVAEMEDWRGDFQKPARGFVIESHPDPQRGISAVLVIKDGTLRKGDYVAAGEAYTGTRIMENFLGEPVEKAVFSSPVRVVGWSKSPPAGAAFETFASRQAAKERAAQAPPAGDKNGLSAATDEDFTWLPLVVKSDTNGTGEALEREIEKIRTDRAAFKIVRREVGAVSETDVKTAGAGGLIVGFNIGTEAEASAAAEQVGATIKNFDVIYRLTEWLGEELERRRPRRTVEEITGQSRILKVFSRTRKKQIVGGRVTAGLIAAGENFRLLRRGETIGEGRVLNLEKNKVKVKEAETGAECGLLVESGIEIAVGDVLEIFRMVEK